MRIFTGFGSVVVFVRMVKVWRYMSVGYISEGTYPGPMSVGYIWGICLWAYGRGYMFGEYISVLYVSEVCVLGYMSGGICLWGTCLGHLSGVVYVWGHMSECIFLGSIFLRYMSLVHVGRGGTWPRVYV